MNIAYLSTFYPYRGGIAQFNACLYRELEKQGHNVKAYTFTTQYPNFLFPGKTQFVTENDIADKIDSVRCLNSINPFSYYKTARLINQQQPDLLVMKYWMSFFGPSLGTAAGRVRKKGTKVVTILDNVIPHEKRFFDASFTKYFLKRNDGFIAMSESVKNDLLSLAPNAKVILKPHPLYDHFGKKLSREQACKNLNIDPAKKNLLFFGIIRDYKGLDLLIEAFSKLDNSYQLIIAGEVYGSFDKYQAQIDAIPNKENVKLFNHYISDAQVPDFFSAADVVVLPYKSATQSGITSIAYHFELPLIATDVGGLKESITHEKTGLIVPESTSEKILESIRQYYEGNRQENFRTNILALKEELSWKNFADELIRFSKTL